MAIKDHSNRMSMGSVKARKLDPLSHEPKSLGNTATQNSSKAFHRQRGHVNSVGNNILIKQMQASNQKLERIEHRIKSLE